MNNEHDKLVEFKAEIKSDVKYLRVDISKVQETLKELTNKTNDQDKEIAVLKAKVAIYAGIIGTIVSVVVTAANALLGG